ncbi:hypothetical protein [Microcoleus sp. PH2017_26_ELK_O_A]|uniref:hypothetical protein n=1 Tax=Microcoleus sp. PH2017_26_ELK_O_A TaxID=2798836 RepID=UPI0025EFBF69|nr:hypothetical protein [Microcoleus sp. PH2017_26_ELK_O_A]
MRSLTTPELFRRGILRGCKSSVSGVEGVAAGVGVAAGADDADAAVPTVLPRAIDNGLESIAGTAASVVVGETLERFVGAIPSVVGETLERFVGAIPSVVGSDLSAQFLRLSAKLSIDLSAQFLRLSAKLSIDLSAE